MNVNSLSGVNSPYLQSLLNTSVSGTTGSGNASSLTSPQESNSQLSPLANILSTLQQLQETNPARYQQITGQIATNLRNAAKTAAADGNTTLANQLNQLASDFTSASQNNTLPNIQDLAQAVGGAHGHHHHHHGHAPSSASNTTGSSADDSSNSSSTLSSTAQVSGLGQLISSLLGNSSSSAQNGSLNPLSIIDSTLSNAGL